MKFVWGSHPYGGWLIVVSLCLLMQGCLTFRENPKQLAKYFERNQVNGSLDTYVVRHRKMHFAQAGDPTRPMVLFVHGSPGSLSAFVPYLVDSALLKNAFLVTTDRPGFGYSSFGYGEPQLKDQAFILKHLIESKKKDQPVILVGHSLGGPLVAKMAMDYPELIDGLVIIAGSIDPALEPNESWFRAPLASPFLSWILPRSLRASNKELYHLKPQLQAMAGDWDKITCPVVVVHGKRDQLVPFGNLEFAQRVLAHTELETIIHDTANHFIPWQNPDLVNRGILMMLNKISSGTFFEETYTIQ